MATPHYWMQETSGVLLPAVMAYLSGDDDRLTGEHIGALRAYFRQWICAKAWDLGPHTPLSRRTLAFLREGIDGLMTREALEKWIDAATRFGADPL